MLRNHGVCERMFLLWISRFNAVGIDGLNDRPRPGRPRNLDASTIASDMLPVIDDPSLAGETIGPSSNFAVGCARNSKATAATGRSCATSMGMNTSVNFPGPCPHLRIAKRRSKCVLLALDNASWHKTKSLRWHPIAPLQS